MIILKLIVLRKVWIRRGHSSG